MINPKSYSTAGLSIFVEHVTGMDPSKKSPSFLKLIEDDDPIFLEIPIDFASVMWGEQPPYKESVKIIDGNNIWFVKADEFRRQCYGKKFKGGESTLYVGYRFWNVKMDGLSNSCVLTHGCSEMVNDLALDRRSTFVFVMAGYKTFKVSVFNHVPVLKFNSRRLT
ncbi:putative transcription factor B3-Domain family [Helianthus annuus]|nr:putative transcription factor B3-Domain family [Helianthus annuus]